MHQTDPNETKIALIEQSLEEAAWLISRGTRPLAISASGLISELPVDGLNWLNEITDLKAYKGVHREIFITGDSYEVLYAAEEWVLELYLWLCNGSLPKEHSEAITGLLLGYSPNAIAAFLRREDEYVRQTRTNPKPNQPMNK